MFTGSAVAIITPMSADGQVDFAALEKLINWHVEQGTDALVVAGTTGESATLTKAEHIAVIEAAVAAVNRRIPVIAGTGSNSTAQTVALSAAVDKLGVDGYLVVTPYYNKPPQDGLVQHFRAVADAVTLPVMLYNVPGRTAVDLLPESVAKLASHPNIFGIKEATGDLQRVAQIQELCGSDFRLYSGDDPTSREFVLLGGHGVVSVTANIAPALMAQMCREALAGNAQQAAQIDASLEALHRDLFVASNPMPVKWALERMGKVGPGIRLPLLPLSAAAAPVVERALLAAGIELEA
jgi:4-hydroxy-tetrahydrodipicolinate synthase